MGIDEAILASLLDDHREKSVYDIAVPPPSTATAVKEQQAAAELDAEALADQLGEELDGKITCGGNRGALRKLVQILTFYHGPIIIMSIHFLSSKASPYTPYFCLCL